MREPLVVNYILERLRSDSGHVAELARIDGEIGHPGVKGRFRELLLNNLLMPWLPSGVACGTGLIIDHRQEIADAGQEDIIVFDPFLAPSVFASPNSDHGVYFFDSVLCRIEVKSKLRKDDLAKFVASSSQLARLQLAGREDAARQVFGALNMLVAFSSEIADGSELRCLREAMTGKELDPVSGIVSSLCVADRGFWLLGRHESGLRWKTLRLESPHDPLAYFAGVTSNTCFDQRAARQGLKPVGGGIGMYLEHPFDFVGDV